VKKKLCCVFLLITITMLFSGCWSRTEPKNLSLTNSVLFDIKDDGEYQLTKEIMKLSNGAGGKGESTGSSVVLLDCEGKTVAEAVRDELNGKALFGGNLKARLFSEKLAKKGMMPVMDFLSRDHLTDETSFVAVVKGSDPKRVYSSTVSLSDMVGNYIDELSKTQLKIKNESVYITTLDFIKDYYEEGKQPVAGLIEIVENESAPENNSQTGSQGTPPKKYKMVYSGLAAFKDDKLVGYMDAIETRSYNFVTDKVEGAIVSLPDDLTAAKVTKSKSNIKTDIENGQVTISVNTKVALSVIQDGGDIDVNKIGPLKILEQKFNKQLETEIAASIQKAQTEFQSDIFGFGGYVHSQHPKEWRNMKTTWDGIFSKAKVNVTVDSSVFMSGETKNAFDRKE
jgi:spore germination protein KC